jgi:hypothetical protein
MMAIAVPPHRRPDATHKRRANITLEDGGWVMRVLPLPVRVGLRAGLRLPAANWSAT